MNKKNTRENICLIMQGGPNWIGGSEYILNLVIALHIFRQSAGETFKINLITGKSTAEGVIQEITKYVDTIFYEEDELPAITLINRVIWWVQRKVFKNIHPRWSGFFKRHHIDVIYPINPLSQGRSATLAIAWIYDFQHKYLPRFFKPWEIKARENGFSKVAQYAPAIIVSSKAAQNDFAQFLPWASHKSKVLSFRSPGKNHVGLAVPQIMRMEMAERAIIVSVAYIIR